MIGSILMAVVGSLMIFVSCFIALVNGLNDLFSASRTKWDIRSWIALALFVGGIALIYWAR